MALPLLKTVQVPQLQFIDNFVDIPVVVVQRQGHRCFSWQFSWPVDVRRQVPMVFCERPVEIPQVPQLRADLPDHGENC